MLLDVVRPLRGVAKIVCRGRANERGAGLSAEFDQIFPLGEPNDAFAQYFVGQSYLAPLVSGGVP